MEPVGLVASIVTLLKVCGSVGQLVASIRDAPRELQDLARTVDSLKLIMKEVESRCSSNTAGQAALHYQLLQVKTSLDDLSALIGEISHPMKPKSGVRLLVARWPVKKRKANAILQELTRARDGITILIACQTNQSSQLAVENINLIGKQIDQHQNLLLQATQNNQLENAKILATILENQEHFLAIERDVLRLRRASHNDTDDEFSATLRFPSREMVSQSFSSLAALPPSSTKSSWQRELVQSFPRNTCSLRCLCLCHSTRYVRSPEKLRSYLGQLFATFTGSLTAVPTCSDSSCRSQCALDLRAFYASPTWLCSKVIYFMCQRTRLGELNLQLKVRVVTVDNLLFDRVQVGAYKAVRSMLARHEVSPDEVDQEQHMTALHYAIDRGRTDICELLLYFGADPSVEDSSGISAQHLAWVRILSNFKSPLVVAELKRIICAQVSSDCLDLSPLHKRIIGLTCEPALDDFGWSVYSTYVNARDKFGRTPLSWAAERDDENAIRYLLQHGAELEVPDYNLGTPLRYASLAPTANAMCILLEQGASVAPESRSQNNALHDVAYHKRDLAYVRLLQDAACLLDHRNSSGKTPLTKAIYADNDIVAEYLLQCGANPHNVDKFGVSCVAQAVQSGANRVLRLLLDFKAGYHHIDNRGCSILHTAAAFEAVNEETLGVLVSARLHGVDIGLRNKSGHTAAQVLFVRTDINGAFREKFRQLLDSIVPPEPRKAGPSHYDVWPIPATIM